MVRSFKVVKILRIRKAVSITEYPAIGKISVRASTLLVVVLFIYWVGLDSDEMDCLFRRQVSTFMS